MILDHENDFHNELDGTAHMDQIVIFQVADHMVIF